LHLNSCSDWAFIQSEEHSNHLHKEIFHCSSGVTHGVLGESLVVALVVAFLRNSRILAAREEVCVGVLGALLGEFLEGRRSMGLPADSPQTTTHPTTREATATPHETGVDCDCKE
ncbi:hypothetical protein PMAYCL1PPCAC_30244, partial [Pristionchus mayeri]